MKRITLVLFAIAFIVYLSGCGKKELAQEEQEAVSMESLSTISTETKPALVESKAQATQATQAAAATQPLENLELLLPSGPYKPTVQEIQTALKNANFYAVAIDGKKGSITTRAIEDFQKANGLKVDGKVGPKTWSVLSVYLNPSVETPSKKKQ